MRKLVLSIILLCIAYLGYAQAPDGFNYQAVMRDLNNTAMTNMDLVVTVEIVQGVSSSDPVYTEIHTVRTSSSGVFNFIIGNGDSPDDFSAIDWENGPFYLRVLVDDEEYTFTRLQSVPYSKHATTAERISSFGVSDTGDTLTINGTQYVVPGISAQNTKAFADQKVLGGTDDESISIAMKDDAGAIWLAGTTKSSNGDVSGSHGEQDIWIVKLNADKSIAWQKAIGGSGYETINQLILTSDGGCIFGGTSESSDGDIAENQGDFDILVGKLSATGDLSWNYTYGGGNTEFLNHLSQTSDGGLLVGATSFSFGGDVAKNYGDADIWIFKINTSFEIEWQKSLGGLRYDALRQLNANDDGTYTVFGITESNDGNVLGNNGAMDVWAANLDASRNVTTQVCLGESNNDDLMTVVSKSSNYLLGGISFSSDWSALNSKSSKNIQLMELTSALSEVQNEQLGGSNAEELVQFIPLSNGETLMVAETYSNDGDVETNNGDQDIWIAVLNSSFGIEKSGVIGGSYAETISACTVLSDGSYLLAGTSESSDGDMSSNNGETDILVLKLDTELGIDKIKTFGGTYGETVLQIFSEENDEFTLVGTTSSSDYGIEGFHGKGGKNTDIWVLTEGF